ERGARDKARVVERTDVATLEAAQGEQIDGDSAAERGGRNALQVRVHVDERFLDAEREDDDPRDHWQVQVRIRVAGDAGALRRPRLAQLPLGDCRHDVEVGPPETS